MLNYKKMKCKKLLLVNKPVVAHRIWWRLYLIIFILNICNANKSPFISYLGWSCLGLCIRALYFAIYNNLFHNHNNDNNNKEFYCCFFDFYFNEKKEETNAFLAYGFYCLTTTVTTTFIYILFYDLLNNVPHFCIILSFILLGIMSGSRKIFDLIK